METKVIYEKLNEIFRDIFDDEELVVSGETTAADVEGWNSLMHINLVIAVEKCFGIKFKMEDFSAMKNVGAMAALIEKYSSENR